MSQEVSVWRLSELDASQRESLLQRTESDLSSYIQQVMPVIEAVKQTGDAALVEYAQKFDGATIDLATLKVSAEEFEAAEAALTEDIKASIHYAAENIRRYHEAQKQDGMTMQEVRPCAFVGERYRPIPSVACYVPRGKGSFPSVALMNIIPAVVAGVKRIIVLTPPAANGGADAATLYVAKMLGVTDVYKCGGAQAVAAVAYGTEQVPKCSKIVGPGSPWMVAAKQVLAGKIDPGLPAGPSESIVFADASVDGALAALDLLIEAEHGADSSAFLVTTSERIVEEALKALPEHWAEMGQERVAYSQAVLGGNMGGIVLADSTQAAFDFINDYAPEHLQVLSTDAWQYLGLVENASEILLGVHTPSTLGNFVLGCNAVLPTSGAAATVSPLSVFDFMKFMSVAYVTEAGYPELAKHAKCLATYEGFDAHARAVSQQRNHYLPPS